MKLKIFRLSASKVALVALLVVAWQTEAQARKTLYPTIRGASFRAGLTVCRVFGEARGRVGRKDDRTGTAHGGPVVPESGSTNQADLIILPVGAAVRPGETVRAEVLNEPLEETGRHAGRTP